MAIKTKTTKTAKKVQKAPVKKQANAQQNSGSKGKWKVLVTHRLPGDALVELAKQCDVTTWDKVSQPTNEELKKLVVGKQALLCMLENKVDRELLESGRDLKIVANYAVGYDNIDVQSASERNVIVTNTPNVLNQAVAEHTFALIMAIARRVVESDKITRSGTIPEWEPEFMLGVQLKGKTLGIIGLGRIGREVARIASKGFNMQVVYNSPTRDWQVESETGARYASKEDLLKLSDFVSLHVPLTPDTRHLIGANELKLMKRSAYLINTARGPVVDEKALAAALAKKQIAGAGIDVFEFEPTVTPELLKLENVVLTPHIASATLEARSGMAKLAVDNILAVMAGKPPLTPVTKQ